MSGSDSEGSKDFDSRADNAAVKRKPVPGPAPKAAAAPALKPAAAPAPKPDAAPASKPDAAPAAKPAEPIAKPAVAADPDTDSSWSDDSSIELIPKGKLTTRKKPLAKSDEAAEPDDLEAETFVRRTHLACPVHYCF